MVREPAERSAELSVVPAGIPCGLDEYNLWLSVCLGSIWMCLQFVC